MTEPRKRNCNHQKYCPANHKLAGQLHYLLNPDPYKDRAKISSKINYQKRKDTYFSREDIREKARLKTRQWTKDNPARKRATDKAYVKANPALVTAYKAKRRAAARNATPPWLTEQHLSEIRSFYEEAATLTGETGIQHEVDHIIPLRAGNASGLHVPWNLRVLSRDNNNRRPRKFSSEELVILQHL